MNSTSMNPRRSSLGRCLAGAARMAVLGGFATLAHGAVWTVGADSTLTMAGSVGGDVVVASGGTLAGGGNIGSVALNSGGTLAPNLASGFNVSGTVNLGSGTLALAMAATPAVGTAYTIINNDGSDAVSGTFAGLAEGAIYAVGSTSFFISYVGGDGNDIALRARAAPSSFFTGTTATGTGSATANVSGGGATCGFTAAQFVPAVNPPAGVTFPHGLFNFTLSGCPPGSAVTLTITYQSGIPAGTQYWKYGPTSGNPTSHWYTIPATIAGNAITFTITDGGLGDDDLLANGAIADAGGPGVPGVATGIPTLSEWGMLLLIGLMALLGMAAVRRQSPA